MIIKNKSAIKTKILNIKINFLKGNKISRNGTLLSKLMNFRIKYIFIFSCLSRSTVILSFINGVYSNLNTKKSSNNVRYQDEKKKYNLLPFIVFIHLYSNFY